MEIKPTTQKIELPITKQKKAKLKTHIIQISWDEIRVLNQYYTLWKYLGTIKITSVSNLTQQDDNNNSTCELKCNVIYQFPFTSDNISTYNECPNINNKKFTIEISPVSYYNTFVEYQARQANKAHADTKLTEAISESKPEANPLVEANTKATSKPPSIKPTLISNAKTEVKTASNTEVKTASITNSTQTTDTSAQPKVIENHTNNDQKKAQRRVNEYNRKLANQAAKEAAEQAAKEATIEASNAKIKIITDKIAQESRAKKAKEKALKEAEKKASEIAKEAEEKALKEATEEKSSKEAKEAPTKAPKKAQKKTTKEAPTKALKESPKKAPKIITEEAKEEATEEAKEEATEAEKKAPEKTEVFDKAEEKASDKAEAPNKVEKTTTPKIEQEVNILDILLVTPIILNKIKTLNKMLQLILCLIIQFITFTKQLESISESTIKELIKYINNHTSTFNQVINLTTIDEIHTFIYTLITTLFTTNKYLFLNYDGITFAQQISNSIVKVSDYYYMLNTHGNIEYNFIIIKVTCNLVKLPINIVFNTDTASFTYTLCKVLIINSNLANSSLCIVHNNNTHTIINSITEHTTIITHTSINEWLKTVQTYNNYVFYTHKS